MKTLKFKSHLVRKILDRSKTVTWRLFDDKNLQVGDKVEFINSDTKEKFAEAEIIHIKEKKLGEVEDLDYEGHERYYNQKDMLEHYRNYYGDKVNLNTVIKIIKFKLL